MPAQTLLLWLIQRHPKQQIEHIFGTLKRKWGFGFTDLRGLGKVNGEFALIMTVYNLKRTINLLGIEDLTEKIKNWKPDYNKVSWPLKYCFKVPITQFLDYFNGRTTAVKQTGFLNSVQFSNNPKCLYALEMGFFEKSNSSFTV
jgi:hypothetical protein